MIDLRPNCVAQYTMNDNRDSPWVAGLNGIPPELPSNPRFDDDSVWTWNWPWFHDVNKAKATHTGTWGGRLSQNINSISGKTYTVVLQVIEIASGGVKIFIGGTQIDNLINEGGWYTCLGIAGDSNTLLEIEAGGYGEEAVIIDNVFCICLDDFPLTGVLFDDGNCFTSDHSVAGKINTALSFDGTNDYIIVYDEGALEFPSNDQDFSIWVWFKRVSTGGLHYIFDKRDGENDGWVVYFWSNDYLICMINSVQFWADAPITDTESWHLFMLVVNRESTARIYIDNVAACAPKDISGQTMSIDSNLFIGRRGYFDDRYFHGKLDAAGFANKALSQAERAFIWNGGNCTERLWGYEYGPIGRGIGRGVLRGVR